ncbi:hypothetical protein JOC36_001439 [Weissella uvarum]|uniref:hypothetical protein n=1 Tax=Weissella uvarum TaxID=1479233 RepID=UPI0019616286|nr:hypothetical protein [Weissella uvarum]MBM7617846.1 hypothetical protein [Weissella uvarum]MCM0596156.1 hypothetical protein [Weissella uvarum]
MAKQVKVVRKGNNKSDKDKNSGVNADTRRRSNKKSAPKRQGTTKFDNIVAKVMTYYHRNRAFVSILVGLVVALFIVLMLGAFASNVGKPNGGSQTEFKKAKDDNAIQPNQGVTGVSQVDGKSKSSTVSDSDSMLKSHVDVDEEDSSTSSKSKDSDSSKGKDDDIPEAKTNDKKKSARVDADKRFKSRDEANKYIEDNKNEIHDAGYKKVSVVKHEGSSTYFMNEYQK